MVFFSNCVISCEDLKPFECKLSELRLFLKYIKNDQSFLEREPMEILTKKKQLIAFKHNKFWQCMDTVRDMENLNIALSKNNYFE